MVEFEVGDVAGGTVADQEEREREEARRFRNDPFVKQVQALFHGTIDDTTVKANTD